MRFLCSTHLCSYQAAALCHARQREATLRAQRDEARAERDALLMQVGGMADELRRAREGQAFYMRLYRETVEAAR